MDILPDSNESASLQDYEQPKMIGPHSWKIPEYNVGVVLAFLDRFISECERDQQWIPRLQDTMEKLGA